MDILEISEIRQRKAREIISNLHLIRLWENIGATVYIVGSLKTGLLIHRDMDFHIYSDEISITDSFSVMGELAEKGVLQDIRYKNLLNTEEECLEWHALYKDEDDELWKFDMIHIRSGSKYDGVVEKVTDAIIRRLTPEIRKTILRIKYDMPEEMIIPGIEVYHAVFTGKVKSYKELLEWRKTNPLTNSLEWLP